MSSLAAQMLEESKGYMADMGIEVDTESNAVKIPTISFPNGINGEAETKVKKIYPNDPCPCGSGKKYKKCCGRK